MPGDNNVKRDAGSPIFNWPHDDEGNPMVMVSFQCSELIGLPNYSNVTVGPAAVHRFVNEADAKNGLRATADLVEEILREERQTVQEAIRKQTQG